MAGACALSAAGISGCGGFDEDYFSYHEDVDLGFRLRLRGLTCLLIPTAVVHHVGSASTGKRSDFSVYHGHHNWRGRISNICPLYYCGYSCLLDASGGCFLFVLFHIARAGKCYFAAKIDALRGLPRIMKKRREVQRSRSITTADLYRVMSRNWLTPFVEFLKRRSG